MYTVPRHYNTVGFLRNSNNRHSKALPWGRDMEFTLWVETDLCSHHDDVMKWKRFPRYWPFVMGIHRSPVDSPFKGSVTAVLMFFFDVRLNKLLNEQSNCWWVETPRRSFDAIVMAVTEVLYAIKAPTVIWYMCVFILFTCANLLCYGYYAVLILFCVKGDFCQI